MKQLKGSSSIGHNRYSTVGSSQLTNAQVTGIIPNIFIRFFYSFILINYIYQNTTNLAVRD
jgi:hypothetical protein